MSGIFPNKLRKSKFSILSEEFVSKKTGGLELRHDWVELVIDDSEYMVVQM